MAFLDNSGDIILDAVLTDAGRQRMARGEFKIVKFAFSDEEIDYSLFNGNHPSGSAFADLSIMQTPILEAFTNNTSLMNTKLISINRNNILYLPLFRRNNFSEFRTENPASFTSGYFVSADAATDTAINLFSADAAKGFFPFDLANKGGGAKSNKIRIDQGMDTGGSPSVIEDMPSDLNETAYLVRIDHRLLRLHTGITTGETAYAPLSNSFVDDDAIASYYVPSTSEAVNDAKDYGSDASTAVGKEMFDGPLGRQLSLMVKSSQAVQSSDALFDELGTTGTGTDDAIPVTSQSSKNYKFIDTTVNVVGVTSGYSIDIPIRIWKKFQ